VGTLQSPALTELSGLVASRAYPGVYWAHNDSGDTARFFALGDTGQDLGYYNITGATANDWEDIAIGPGPIPGQDYLYIADVGDNLALRTDVRIYRVAEPFASLGQPASTVVNVSGVDELIMTYPLAAKYDCEAVFCDPATGDLFLVTKELTSTRIFRNPAPHTPGSPVTLELVATIAGATFTTAADISFDGAQIALRGYTMASLRTRASGTTVAEAFALAACPIPLSSESQGEALAFAADGCTYITISEGFNSPINRYIADAPCAPIFPDQDGDGLSDSVEASLCTENYLADSDADGLSDFYEVTNNGTGDPADYNPGVTHTDACNPDTDTDGVSDLQEINFGFDPLDPGSTPALPGPSRGWLVLLVCMVLVLSIRAGLMRTRTN